MRTFKRHFNIYFSVGICRLSTFFGRNLIKLSTFPSSAGGSEANTYKSVRRDQKGSCYCSPLVFHTLLLLAVVVWEGVRKTSRLFWEEEFECFSPWNRIRQMN